MFKGLKRLDIYWVRFTPDAVAMTDLAEEEEHEPVSVLVPQDFLNGLDLQVCHLSAIASECPCLF